MSREDIRFCKLCNRLVDVSGMQMVHRRGSITTFLDKKGGVVHAVLSRKASEKFRPKAPQKPEVTLMKPAHTAPVEAPCPSEILEQWTSEKETAQEADLDDQGEAT